MRRGDRVTIALQGDYGKPPGTNCPVRSIRRASVYYDITRDERASRGTLFRIPVQPDADNGLLKPFQIMLDKAHRPSRENREKYGRLNNEALLTVNRALVVFLGFA